MVESWESERRWGVQLGSDHLVRSSSYIGHDLFGMTPRYDHAPLPCDMINMRDILPCTPTAASLKAAINS